MMPGWDGFSIPGWFSRHYDAPVLVDNDVNIMALGEHWTHWRDTEHLLYVKIGTGIGCGIVSGRRIHRGAQGAAGDIGHVRLAGHDDVVCRCGNVGCLEAVAGGRALAAKLTRGRAGRADLARRGQARAGGRAGWRSRPCARPAAASARCWPSASTSSTRARSCIGGDISEAHQQLLAGVREVSFGRSLPMATRDLRMGCSQLGDRAGVIGAAIMVIEHVLAPETVDRAIQAYMSTRRAAPTVALSRVTSRSGKACRFVGPPAVTLGHYATPNPPLALLYFRRWRTV